MLPIICYCIYCLLTNCLFAFQVQHATASKWENFSWFEVSSHDCIFLVLDPALSPSPTLHRIYEVVIMSVHLFPERNMAIKSYFNVKHRKSSLVEIRLIKYWQWRYLFNKNIANIYRKSVAREIVFDLDMIPLRDIRDVWIRLIVFPIIW